MYKEVINNYRDMIDSLNILKLQGYLERFNDGEKYLEKLNNRKNNWIVIDDIELKKNTDYIIEHL